MGFQKRILSYIRFSVLRVCFDRQGRLFQTICNGMGRI